MLARRHTQYAAFRASFTQCNVRFTLFACPFIDNPNLFARIRRGGTHQVFAAGDLPVRQLLDNIALL